MNRLAGKEEQNLNTAASLKYSFVTELLCRSISSIVYLRLIYERKTCMVQCTGKISFHGV